MRIRLKSWNTRFEWLRLGVKSFTKEWEWDSSPELTKMKDCDWELNQEIALRLGIQGIKSELNSCFGPHLGPTKSETIWLVVCTISIYAYSWRYTQIHKCLGCEEGIWWTLSSIVLATFQSPGVVTLSSVVHVESAAVPVFTKKLRHNLRFKH